MQAINEKFKSNVIAVCITETWGVTPKSNGVYQAYSTPQGDTKGQGRCIPFNK